MSRCTRCGAPFSCGMVEGGEAPCWCTRLPKLPAEKLPTNTVGAPAACFCPDCLATITGSYASPDGNTPT